MVKTASPAALKLITCKNKIRRSGEIVPCGKQYLRGDGTVKCPDREFHVTALVTGYCSNGWHEGSKAVDWRGNPAPSCEFYLTCPCKCHTDLDKLFAMTGKERILVTVTAYHPPERTFWLPSDDPVPVLSSPRDATPPVLVESPAPDRVPATIARTFDPTPSGRAARGELEAWVKQHCDIWLIDEPGTPCTPTYLGEEIARDMGITPPSVGAISAVFDRWVKLGFAVCEKKPTRFVRYTEEGVRIGLDAMKAQAKRAKRLGEAEHRRNNIR